MPFQLSSRQWFSIFMAVIAGFSSVTVTVIILRWKDIDNNEQRQWSIIRDMQRKVDLMEYQLDVLSHDAEDN